jgi:hypothetical protein
VRTPFLLSDVIESPMNHTPKDLPAMTRRTVLQAAAGAA